MKVVVIGGGVISKKLVSAAPSEFQLVCFSIRNVPDSSSSWGALLDDCQDAEIIVYLAYHHRDLIKNIKLLGEILSSLKNSDWRGKLVFFNTQSVLAAEIFKSQKPLKRAFSFDLYTSTKRLQSRLLSRYSQKLNISEIYLPVVLGSETKAQKRYTDISRHKIVHLPNKGVNLFAYLELDVFLLWFWTVYINKLTTVSFISKNRKIFVYQGVLSFVEVIEKLRASQEKEINLSASELDPLVVYDCKYKYIFSNSVFENIFFSIKMTPIWLILIIIRNEFKRLISSEWTINEAHESRTNVDKPFFPTGAEYQYLCTTIDLDSIPFHKIRIKS